MKWQPTMELRFKRIRSVVMDTSGNATACLERTTLQQKWRIPDFPKDQIEWRNVPLEE